MRHSELSPPRKEGLIDSTRRGHATSIVTAQSASDKCVGGPFSSPVNATLG